MEQAHQNIPRNQMMHSHISFVPEHFIVSRRRWAYLEFLKLFLVFAGFSFADLQYVESDGFTERTALAHSYHITKSNIPENKNKKKCQAKEALTICM